MDPLVLLGALLIIVGVLILITGINGKNIDVRGGGAVLIGPIPIGFGTDTISLIVVMLIALVIMVLFYLRFL